MTVYVIPRSWKWWLRKPRDRSEQLIEWGAEFDKESNGKFNLAREGGHSEHRILHHKDNTGFEIQRALAKAVKEHPNITIFEYFFAIDIITQHHLGKLVKRYFPDIECFGAYVLELNTGIIHTFLARVTMIATGGIGNLYHMTTNPMTATGDGIAMVYRAKGYCRQYGICAVSSDRPLQSG